MILSPRQQKARDVTSALGAWSNQVWVTNPMPLADGARLRIQISDHVKNEVLQVLRDFGYEPRFVAIHPRIATTGLMPAAMYEVDIPVERQEVPQDERAIPRDDAGRRVKDPEIEATLDAIYGRKRRR
jgi:hypothetical protein